jgi:hypothetical protein
MCDLTSRELEQTTHYTSDQQIMPHLSLLSPFEKSLSLYQSRLMMFAKKKYSKIQILNK